MKKTIFALWAIISLFSLSIFAQSVAITNARIVTVSGAPIEKGTVVIRDGIITDVGTSAKIPTDAKVFDGNGLTVYPGFFDPVTNLGLAAAPTPQPMIPQVGGGGARGPQQPQAQQPTSISNYPTGLQPELIAFDQFRGTEAQFESYRNQGFTTVLTVPRDGIFNGQSAIINLAGDNASAMLIKSPVALHVSFVTLRGGGYPGSLLGTFSATRQMFLDAQRLNEWKKSYAANPKGVRRPEADPSLEALLPALNRQMPVVFNANSEIEIIRALDFAKEFNLKPIIAGGTEAGKVADRLKKADAVVLLSLNFPKRTTASSPEADPESLEVLRMRVEAPKNAAKLKQAGVKFAFQSGGLQSISEFFTNAAKTTENGLSKDDAVKAMTWSAADIFGLSDRLGSIETGKIANLVVVRGDVLSKEKAVTHVFVDGKLFEQKPPAAPNRGAGQGRGPGGAGAAPNTPAFLQVGGTWNLIVEAPGQAVPMTVVLTQAADKLTGQLQSQALGSAPIKNGMATSSGFSFDASITFSGQSLDITVSGKVTGDKVEGSVSTPMGAIPFSGTKVP